MTSLNNVNTRLLINHIQKSIELSLEQFVFKSKGDFTKRLIQQNISFFMDNMKSKNSIYDYKVEVNGEKRELDWIEMVLGRNMENFDFLNVDVYVQPTKTLEIIKINFVVK